MTKSSLLIITFLAFGCVTQDTILAQSDADPTMEKLSRLKKMYEKGLITDAEYAQGKQQLIGTIVTAPSHNTESSPTTINTTPEKRTEHPTQVTETEQQQILKQLNAMIPVNAECPPPSVVVLPGPKIAFLYGHFRPGTGGNAEPAQQWVLFADPKNIKAEVVTERQARLFGSRTASYVVVKDNDFHMILTKMGYLTH